MNEPAKTGSVGFLSGRSRRLALAGGVLVLAVSVAALVWRMLPPMPNHLCTVTAGVLYRSACPRPDELGPVIKRYGIRTVVNLCVQGETTHPSRYAQEEPICAENGAKLVNLPIIPDEPPSDRVLKAWLELLRDPARRPVLVHCKHGVVRTGEMVAVYEVEFLHRTGDEAWNVMPKFGHDFETPRRAKVRDFIRSYAGGAGK